jgi:hypothetical protein
MGLINLVVFQLFTHIIGEEEDEVTKNDQIWFLQKSEP